MNKYSFKKFNFFLLATSQLYSFAFASQDFIDPLKLATSKVYTLDSYQSTQPLFNVLDHNSDLKVSKRHNLSKVKDSNDKDTLNFFNADDFQSTLLKSSKKDDNKEICDSPNDKNGFGIEVDLDELLRLAALGDENLYLPTPVKKSSPFTSKMLNDQKSLLKPVSDEEKNNFAKSLSPQQDQYNFRKDVKSFIKKLHLKNNLLFKNNTNEPIKLKIKLELIDNKDYFIYKNISIQPSEFYVQEQTITKIKSVKVIGNVTKFLNPKFSEDANLQLSIENEQDNHFLHQYHHFDFKTKAFTIEELGDPTLSLEDREFRANFNNHIAYVDEILAKDEGTTLEEIDAQRRNLYNKNNIMRLLKINPSLLHSAEYKIPLITHKIWVTSDTKPVSIPKYYLNWIENSEKHNSVSEGWSHYLWIESKEKLPELTKKLENHPTIKLKELKELKENLVTGDYYKEALQAHKFGMATDILRLEILQQLGGYYLDTDYELFQSLKVHSKAYDLIMGLEPMSALLCNAFIGSRPDHEVINKALSLINRNRNAESAPDYIKNNTDTGWKTIIETGPGLVTAAFKLAAGQGDNVDIILPPQVIYPTPENVYPKKQVVKPDSAIPAEAIGAHYWETAWMRAEFGSEG